MSASSILTYLGIGAGVILLGTALGFGIAWLWRRARLVLVVLVLLMVVAALVWLYEFVLPARYPTIDQALPIFRPLVWTWMLLFTLLALGTTIALVRGLWRRPTAGGDEDAGQYPDIDAAWEAIQLRLGQAQIDPADQRFILFLAPDEAELDVLIRSAALQLYAEAPAPGAPIRAYATAEAILLGAAGACGFASHNGGGSDRLAYLCRLLRDLNPECPTVRGVVIVFPTDWASQPEAPRQAAAIREDLLTIGATLKVRPPVFAIFGRFQEVDGLAEFIARMPEATRAARCGFAIPASATFTGDLASRGLAWLSGWFDTWCLNLIAADPTDTAGNGRLCLLTDEIRRRRRRWRDVLEAAFSTHREAEPVPLRGLYGVASGTTPAEQAFASGLLRGARSRIVADTIMTDWAAEAHDDDRVYRRAALAVGLVGGLLCLMTWVFIIGRGPFWWIGLLAVIAVWIVVLTRMLMRS